jgi:hypothetical protein
MDSIVFLKEINEKLKKFEEHLRTIAVIHNSKNNKNAVQDMTYLTTLIQYIHDLFELDRNIESAKHIKRTIMNIETSIISFKGSITVLILLERAKLLALDKMHWMREELRKRKTVNERPSQLVLLDLQKELDEVIRTREKCEIEKDMWKRKAYNLEKSRLSYNRIDDINSDIEGEVKKKKKKNKNNVSDSENTEGEMEDIISYRQFAKYVLKIKFEYQKQCDIPERVLWEEYRKKKISKENLTSWILEEMSEYQKYKKLIDKSKLTSQRNYRALMDTIVEE